MSGIFVRVLAAVCAIATALAPVAAGAGGDAVDQFAVDEANQSVMTIPSEATFPLTKRVSLASGKSLMIQFPVPLKDVLVSDPIKADAVVQSSDRVFLIAKQLGQTNAFFFDETGERILTLEISIGADLSSLEKLLARLIPGSSIKIESAGKAMILTGSVRSPVDSGRASDIATQFAKAAGGEYNGGSSAGAATSSGSFVSGDSSQQGGTSAGADDSRAVINLLAVDAEEQVMLKVTVAEVQRSLLKQMGVNLGASINANSFSTAILTDNALPLTASAGLGALPRIGIGTDGAGSGCALSGALCAYNAGPSGSYSNSGISGVLDTGNSRITGAIRALERAGLIRTLAEPNLTAISGESAKFLAGGEYPVPVVDNQGQLSVTYKEFGVGVAFTPVVLSEGRISLKISTEVSELTNTGAVVLSGISIPALKKRTANSTVELPSGGSLAMAGLLSDDTRQNVDGLPGAKDIPILGTLFRSRDYIKNETELVVIVTPYLVKTAARQDLGLPSDGLAAASDKKANFLGHLNRIYGKSEALPAGDLKGDYGFIVE